MVSILLNIIVCIFRQKTHHQIQTNPIILPRYRNKPSFNLNAKMELQYSIRNIITLCIDLICRNEVFRYHDIPVFHFVSKIRYLKEYPLLHSKYIEIDVNVVYLA